MSRGTLKKIRLRDMCLGTCGRPVDSVVVIILIAVLGVLVLAIVMTALFAPRGAFKKTNAPARPVPNSEMVMLAAPLEQPVDVAI